MPDPNFSEPGLNPTVSYKNLVPCIFPSVSLHSWAGPALKWLEFWDGRQAGWLHEVPSADLHGIGTAQARSPDAPTPWSISTASALGALPLAAFHTFMEPQLRMMLMLVCDAPSAPSSLYIYSQLEPPRQPSTKGGMNAWPISTAPQALPAALSHTCEAGREHPAAGTSLCAALEQRAPGPRGVAPSVKPVSAGTQPICAPPWPGVGPMDREHRLTPVTSALNMSALQTPAQPRVFLWRQSGEDLLLQPGRASLRLGLRAA